MSAPAAVVIQGSAATGGPEDETGFAVEELTWKATREKIEHKNRNGAVKRVKLVNPTVEMNFTGYALDTAASTNIGGAHPGAAISSLANFGAARHGMDPAVGIFVYEDPEVTFVETDDDKLKAKVTHYPFLSNS